MTRQQETFAAMMNNWEEVTRLTEVAANSTGSASQKMEVYLDSVEAKTNQLKATWEELILNLGQSEGYKDFLDFLEFLIKNLPTVVTLLTSTVVAFKAFKAALNMEKNVTTFINGIQGLTKGFNALKTVFAGKQMITGAKTLSGSFTLVSGSMVKTTSAMATTSSTATILTGVLGTLATTLFAVAAVVGVVALGITLYNKHLDNLKDNVDKTNAAFETQKRELDGVNENIKKYQQIAGTISDTATKKNELEAIQKSLISTYGEEAEQLDLVNGKYDEQIKKLNQLEDNKRVEALSTLQQGAKDRRELLNRHTSAAIGNTTSIKKMSEKTQNKIADLIASNNLKTYGFADNEIVEGTAENIYRLTNAFKELQTTLNAEGNTFDAQKIGEMLNAGGVFWHESLSKVNEKTGENTLNDEIQQQYLEFEQNNKNIVNSLEESYNIRESLAEQYNKSLEKIQEKEEKLAKTKSEKKKQQLQSEINTEKKTRDDLYKNLLENNEKVKQAEENFNNVLLGQNDDVKKLAKENYAEQTAVSFQKVSNLGIDAAKTIEGISDDTKKFIDKVESLNEQFNKGEISAQDYFTAIQNGIKNINTTNIDDLKATLATMFSSDTEYFGTFIDDVVSNKYTDTKDIKNLSAITKFTGNMIQTMKANKDKTINVNGQEQKMFNDSLFTGNGMSDEQIKAEQERYQTAKNGIDADIAKTSSKKNELSTKYYDVESRNLTGYSAKGKYNNNSGEISDVKYYNQKGEEVDSSYMKQKNIFTKDSLDKNLKLNGQEKYNEELKNTEDYLNNITKAAEFAQQKIDDIGDSKGLDSLQDDLKNISETLEDMDFGKAQDALDNIADKVSSGEIDGGVAKFNELPKTIQDNFTQVAGSITSALNSENEAMSEMGRQSIINLTGSTEAANQIITANKNDQARLLAEATITNNKTVNAGATAMAQEANKIAQKGMGESLQILGQTLTKIENALKDVNVEIPVHIPNFSFKAENLIMGKPVVQKEQSVDENIKIGGGNSVSFGGLGSILSDTNLGAAVNSLTSSFNPLSYNPKTPTNNNGTGNKKKGSGSGGGSDSTYDPKEDIKKIKEDIANYKASIELDYKDQTEELINHYNLERNKLQTLKEQLDYYNNIYDVTENTSKWLDTQFNTLKNLSKTTEAANKANLRIDAQRKKIIKENKKLSVKDPKTGKKETIKYDVNKWFDSEGNETLAYGSLVNTIKDKIKAAQDKAESDMQKQYNKIKSLKKESGTKGKNNKSKIQAANDEIAIIKKNAETKVKGYKKELDKLETIYEDVSKLNEEWKENKEVVREALEEMHQIIISTRDEMLDDIIEQVERATDKINDSISKSVTRLEQIKQVQESYNSIMNDLIDTQQELRDELEVNMDTYEYLDEDLRQLMFNEDDYDVLSETLSEIQKGVTDIWEDHYKKINELAEDDVIQAQYITAETERQLAAKQKEYEIAKAELDVAKARTNLENVENERNTRMFINGQWQWVANPDAVKDAKKNLADAERVKNKIEREQEQQKMINSLDGMIDSKNLQIDKNNQLLQQVKDKIEEEKSEVEDIKKALNNAQDKDLPALNELLQKALGKDGGKLSTLLDNINEASNKTELQSLLKNGMTTKQAEDKLGSGKLTKSEFENLKANLGYDWNPTTGLLTKADGTTIKGDYIGFKKDTGKDTQTKTAKDGTQVEDTKKKTTTTSTDKKKADKKEPSKFPKDGKVTTSSQPLNLRKDANTSAKIITTMPKGSKVSILGEKNKDWAQVKYTNSKGKSYTGYASRKYLTYDLGGLAKGLGFLPKATIKPERVLSPKQTKAFENLVSNLTTNPVLSALSKVPQVSSNLDKLTGSTDNSICYNFSNFTIQADDIKQFIDSIETMIPMKKK